MENLEILGVNELNKKEAKEVNGGGWFLIGLVLGALWWLARR
ncbi:MAG: hypothetical protein ABJN84_08565 [Flavobacteriaceae bacterium]